MSRPSQFASRKLLVKIVAVAMTWTFAIPASQLFAQFNLAPPNQGGQRNTGGFNIAPPHQSGQINRGGFSQSSIRPPTTYNQSRSNNNGAQIAAGVLGIINAGIQASNQRQSPRAAPNATGLFNNSGFSNRPMIQNTPSYNSGAYQQSYSQPQSIYNSTNSYYPQTYSTPQTYSNSGVRSGGVPQTSRHPEGTMRSVYVQPSSGYSSVASSPNSSGSVAPNASMNVAGTVASSVPGNRPPTLSSLTDSLPVTLRCPSDEIGIFAYQLISKKTGKIFDYTMTPGQKQVFKQGSSWKIRFDKGQGKGTQSYDLAGGTTYQIRRNGDDLWGVYAEDTP